ncbi:ABC transporter ATP-binding protein [Desulfosporosinus metallidurans]|uniref:ABC transporter, ATP-binding protein n=1 Tax=Desulfosporosinus metallidurans TaxID=1888891 RepID=A0A1Q8QP10_9FIRM|nr:ABC transporter ATP-binding protein [Desulfosporosinus metallidurans]OLN29056.1 ABC transporter, ATP-binding protein [Desulfosporosinus metallidurans]
MIEVSDLSKVYREGRGIRNINIRIDPGTAFGFLGPNGAGKTTTIRLLMGFLKPDSGQVTINDRDCWREKTEVKKFVSYLPGELHFIENLSGLDFLDLIAGMHGERPDIKKTRDYLVSALDLDLKLPIRKMSKGMKQKLGIISALMLDAGVLILDEPTSGLDPLMQKVFIELILEEKKKGKTLFMSSHQFSEIERTCERVGIIREGKLLAVRSISQLREVEYHTFEIEVESEEDYELLRGSGLDISLVRGQCYVIRVAGELDRLWLALAQVRVKRFRQRSLELEEAFMDFYR